MKLQLLVPHWDERPDEMEPLLDSVALQQAIDFGDIGVIIAYDGPDATSLPIVDWQDRYPFRIVHSFTEKGGVSATRNHALEQATAEYVAFCDADDMFMDVRGLYYIFQQIDAGFDTLPCTFIEETKDPDGNVIFVPHHRDQTFVHSKFHRRQYLIDNDLRFNPALTIHEDSYFNILAQALCDPSDMSKIRHFERPIYLWRWRDNSVCRDDPLYILKTFGDMIDSSDALIKEFVRRDREDLARQYVAFMVWDSFYAMNKPEWLDESNARYREKVERRFTAYFDEHGSMWKSFTPQELAVMSNGIRGRAIMEGMTPEKVTVDQWLEQIDARYGRD